MIFSTGNRNKKNEKRLQQLVIQAIQSKWYRTLVWSAAFASYLFPSVLKEWQNGTYDVHSKTAYVISISSSFVCPYVHCPLDSIAIWIRTCIIRVCEITFLCMELIKHESNASFSNSRLQIKRGFELE